MEEVELKMISGWLEKKSRYLKTWRKRWVFFDGVGMFTFVKKQNIAGYHQDSKQVYYLQNVHVKATEILKMIDIKARGLIINNDRNMFTIIMMDDKEMTFRCSSNKTLIHWVNHIEFALKIMNYNRFLIAKVMSLESCYYYKVREHVDTKNVILENIELVIESEMRQNIDVKKWYLPYDVILNCCKYYGEERDYSLRELEMNRLMNEDKFEIDDDYDEEDKYLIAINILNSMISIWFCDKTHVVTKMIIILSIAFHSELLNIVLPVDMEMMVFYFRVLCGFLRVTFGDFVDM